MFRHIIVISLVCLSLDVKADTSNCRFKDGITQPYAIMRLFLKRSRLALCHAHIVIRNQNDRKYFDSLHESQKKESLLQLYRLGLLNWYYESRQIYVYRSEFVGQYIYTPLSLEKLKGRLKELGFGANSLKLRQLAKGTKIMGDSVLVERLSQLIPINSFCDVEQYVSAKVNVGSVDELRSLIELIGCDFNSSLGQGVYKFGGSEGKGTLLDMLGQVLNRGSGFYWQMQSGGLELLSDKDMVDVQVDVGNLTKREILEKLAEVGIYGNAVKVTDVESTRTKLKVSPEAAQNVTKIYMVSKKKTFLPKVTKKSAVVEYGS